MALIYKVLFSSISTFETPPKFLSTQLALPVFGGDSAVLSMLDLVPLLLKRKLYPAYCTE
jgi:hypothetical protein